MGHHRRESGVCGLIASAAFTGSLKGFDQSVLEPDGRQWQIEKLGERENLEAAGTKIESERVRYFFHHR
jgi:hypothetical protein